MSGSEQPRILVIDDNEVDREAARRLLRERYTFLEARTANEGLRICRIEQPCCVLLDRGLPDIDGLEVLPRLLALDTSVIMLTGQGNEAVATASLRGGAHDYLRKGDLDSDTLHRSIRNAVDRAELMSQLRTFRLIGERCPIGILIAEVAGSTDLLAYRVTWMNESAQRDLETGSAPTLGRTLGDVFVGLRDHDELRGALENVAAGQNARLPRITVDSHAFDIRLVPLGASRVAVIAENLSEQELLEAQLRQAQKMEAVGQLAGGVAHDFNNLLTAILSFSSFVMDDLRPEEPAFADLVEIRKAAERAEQLIRQLLAFSRRQASQPQLLDINDLIKDMQRMLQRILGEHIELGTDLAHRIDAVKIDPSHLEQVLVNLAVNARDAMPKGGRLTLESRNCVLDEPYAAAHGAAIAPGAYVMLAVSDTGVGMDRETQQRIFEPFFTTKGQSGGTGLGLSTCYGIVKQAGGYVWVYSEPGHGTTFKIYLPRATGKAKRTKRSSTKLPAVGGAETVLVAEDEHQVRALIVRALSRAGYDVLEASNGGEAFLVAEQRSEPIHLLITDMVMPRMNGQVLASRIRRLHPETQVLYISGYTSAAMAQQDKLDIGASSLQKPFSPSELLTRIRELLDAVGGSGSGNARPR